MAVHRVEQVASLSLRRAWIEITESMARKHRTSCRSPYGERGLKSRTPRHRHQPAQSLSLRRAWIEMTRSPSAGSSASSLSLRRAWIEIVWLNEAESRCAGRSPYGERGLKLLMRSNCSLKPASRSPYGERGLKSRLGRNARTSILSLSLRRAWIEILGRACRRAFYECRSPYGERGLKL